jgi:hypothetical protein
MAPVALSTRGSTFDTFDAICRVGAAKSRSRPAERSDEELARGIVSSTKTNYLKSSRVQSARQKMSASFIYS